MSVAVAADPTAEAQKGGRFVRQLRIMPNQGAAKVGDDPRRHRPERRRERQPALDFLRDRRPSRPERVGLPQIDDLRLEPPEGAVPFGGQQFGPIEFHQALAHRAHFVADGAAFGFGRVGGENEFDAQRREQSPQFRDGGAGGGETGDGVGDRFRPRVAGALPFAVAEHPGPVPVLGEIGEVEEYSECADQDFDFGFIEGADFGVQPRGRVAEPEPSTAGERPNFFYKFEGGLPFEVADRFAKQFAEHPDVAPQQIVAYHVRPL